MTDRQLYRKIRYWSRVAEKRCVDCAACLQPGDQRRCLECREHSVARASRYRKTRDGKDVLNAGNRRRRAEKAAAGICTNCLRPAEPGRKSCAVHLASQKLRQAKYLDRREASC